MSVRGRRTAAIVSGYPDAPARNPRVWASLSQQLVKRAGAAAGNPLDAVAAALDDVLAASGARFAVGARIEDGEPVCVAQAGHADTRLAAGSVLPLRWQPAPDDLPFAYLLGENARREPLGEYLRAAGYRTAVVFSVGDASARGVVLLAFEDEGGLSPEDSVLACVALQPLDGLLRRSEGDSEWPAHQLQLEHAQKMEALGSMAGMIAHDFNNLLTTILGYTGIIKNMGRLHRDDAEFLDQVEEATHRAADLTARLLAFARGGVMRSGPLDLRAVVVDALKLAEPALQDRVNVVTDYAADAVPVHGDEGQLQQCLLNILLNARDAMPEGGSVAIAAHRRAGEAVIEISDSGPGMDETTLARIFEPYFTTKPKGSGTGLGLSIAYGVVRGHGGHIEVTSAPGHGTTFTLAFPALAALPPAEDVTRMAAADRDLVLVVDDDDMVRRTTMHTVAHLGYNVVDAPSGRVAIDLVRARPDRFAVVLLDLVMPELTGAQTFKQLYAIRPSLPVVVCTGYAADAHLDDSVKAAIAGLVHKPFSPERLEETLANLNVRRARPREGA